ncbi:MAG: flagellar motor stator protein MotA [Deltaproteobacteria bacterium]|nr:flagellar motor stator protein MotA [Deltaproteobacteria bacterium]
MIAIIGFIVVTVAIAAGYLMEHGNLAVLFQPAEIVIIFGAATGAFLIASPIKVVKSTIGSVAKVFTNKPYVKNDYLDILMLLSEIFYKIRKQGLVSIEGDVDDPKESSIFKNYPKILKNHHAITFITDTLRMVITTTIEPHELESLMETELEEHHEDALIPAKSLTTTADALPGLGIVAAVLGVVLTMGKIGEPPEVLGHSIGAALVGTFLGVLMCYGYVGPMAKNLEFIAQEELQYLNVLKIALKSFVSNNAAPMVAIEFGRRAIPAKQRPSFVEVEDAVRKVRK